MSSSLIECTKQDHWTMIRFLLPYLTKCAENGVWIWRYLYELQQCVRADGSIQWSETERHWWRAFKPKIFYVCGCSFLVYGRRTERDLDILTVLAIQSAFQEQELKACVTVFHNFRKKKIPLPSRAIFLQRVRKSLISLTVVGSYAEIRVL